eukprot:Mrub_07225.p1 GENE.Mrub_07225~~Mrub_07225.p1  ORF type:complete len:165 (-),score=39.30 Mrub_07225:40-534(-)
MFILIVSGGKYSDQLTIKEILNAVHDTFMHTDDVVDVVVLIEGQNVVRADFDDVAALVWFAEEVRQDALDLVGVGGSDSHVDDEQLVAVLHLVHDLGGRLSSSVSCSSLSVAPMPPCRPGSCHRWAAIGVYSKTRLKEMKTEYSYSNGPRWAAGGTRPRSRRCY